MSDEAVAVRRDYEQRKERVAKLAEMTLQSTDGNSIRPTPTQEENDLTALGLLHPDEKAPPAMDKGMPSLAAQQAYLASGEALPAARPAAPAASRQPASPPPPRQHPEQPRS